MSAQRYGSSLSFSDECAVAAVRLDGVARATPLEHNERLSDAVGAQVWLKREDLQVGRSYKLRGAYNLLAQLDPPERAAGAVCASAGPVCCPKAAKATTDSAPAARPARR